MKLQNGFVLVGKSAPADPIFNQELGESSPARTAFASCGRSKATCCANLTFKSPLDIAELARGVASAARFFADGMWDGRTLRPRGSRHHGRFRARQSRRAGGGHVHPP
jgi:hypothetical protein